MRPFLKMLGVVAILLCPLGLRAQSSFTIPVQNQTGAAISGATVTLTCTDTTNGCVGKGPFSATSSGGNTNFTAIPAGNYTVTVSGPGISTYSYAYTVASQPNGGAESPSSLNNIIFVDGVTYPTSPDIGVGWNKALTVLPTTTINGTVYSYGKIVLPPGNFNLSTFVNMGPLVSVQGAGAQATIITCTLNSDCVQFADRVFNNLNPSGTLQGFTILGQGSSNANAVGLHTGDIEMSKLIDINIDNFTGTNSACLWYDNKAGWAERNQGQQIELGAHYTSAGLVQNGCTKELRFTFEAPGMSSFYNDTFLGIHFSVGVGQTGISNESGTWYKGFIQGNANIGGGIGSGAIMWTISGSANINDTFIDLGVECTSCSTNATGWNITSSVTNSFRGPGLVEHDPHIANSGAATNAGELGMQSDNFAVTNWNNNIGAWLHAGQSSADNFSNCWGLNLFLDTTGWATKGDGTNNAGGGVCQSYGDGILNFYTLPPTGGSGQSGISQATLDSTYKRATLSSTGFTLKGTELHTLGSTTVGALPSAASNPGAMIEVTDSTSVASEGQTCVGSSSNKALAFSNGSVWKCF